MSTLPPPEVYKLIGQRIRTARLKRGLSQENLAKCVDLTRTSITNIEKGRQKLLVHTLFLLSDALAVPIVDLLTAEETPDPSRYAKKLLPVEIRSDARDWVLSGLVSAAKDRA